MNFKRLIAYGDNHVNPIVTKEVRQAMQGRMVISILCLFLIVQMGFTFIVLGDMPSAGVYGHNGYSLNRMISTGRDLVEGFSIILVFASFVCIPAYIGNRFNAEKGDDTMDLLYTTTISPFRIVLGKLLTAMSLTMLIFSLCMPFIAITSFFKGVDLMTIVFIIAFAFIIMIPLNIAAIFASTLTLTKPLRTLANLAVLGGSITIAGCYVTFMERLLQFGVSSMFVSGDEWWMFIYFVAALLLGGGLLFVCAVAQISPPSSNKALPVRLYIFGFWLITGLFTYYCILNYTVSRSSNHVGIVMWYIFFNILFMVGMIISIGEPEQVGTRIRKNIPQSPILRPLAYLVYSGVGGGLSFFILLASLTSLFIYNTVEFSHKGEMVFGMFGLCLYCFIYAMMTKFIRKRILRDNFLTLTNQKLMISIGLICALGPLLVLELILNNPGNRWFFGTSTSIIVGPMALFEGSSAALAPKFYALLTVAGVLFIPFLFWVISLYKGFKPLTVVKEEEALDDDVATACQ